MAQRQEKGSEGVLGLIGETVINNKGENVPVNSFVGEGKIIGIYFSAHWCPPCRGFTPKLAEFYENHHVNKNFEIVFASSDRDQASFDSYFAEMPWKAIPFSDRKKKEALSKKFKVGGIPTLILLDSNGEIVNKNARSEVTSDMVAKNFPWKPQTYTEMMTGKLLNNKGEEYDCKEALKGKVTGIYFSAHWCPPCRAFTPELVKCYNKLKEDGKNFEIVFASSDRDEKQFKEYFNEMPWLAIPNGDERKNKLSDLFEVEGIPTLIIMDENNTVITTKGRGRVDEDPEGKEFPWRPKHLNKLSGAVIDDVNEHVCLIMFAGPDDKDADFSKEAEEIMKEEAKLEHEQKEKSLHFMYACNDELVERLRSFTNIDADKRMLVILNIANAEKYEIAEGKDITKEKIKEARQKFLSGNLDDKKASIR